MLRTRPTQDTAQQVLNGLIPRTNHLLLSATVGADIISSEDVALWLGISRFRRRIVALAAAVAAFLSRNKYDCIYATDEDIGWPLGLLLRSAGWRGRLIVVVHACQGLAEGLFRLVGHKPFYRLVSVSRCQSETLVRLGFPPYKLMPVFDSVDTTFFSPAHSPSINPSSEPYVFACGLERRDYDTLLAAMAGLPLRLCILASGLMAADDGGLRCRVISSGFERVDVCQHISAQDIRNLYPGAKFVVVPLHPASYAAGINALLEAMAMGKAVIVTQSPGIREYLRSASIVTVPAHDVSALASAISHLSEASELLHAYGERNRCVAERLYTLENYVNSITTLMLSDDRSPSLS